VPSSTISSSQSENQISTDTESSVVRSQELTPRKSALKKKTKSTSSKKISENDKTGVMKAVNFEPVDRIIDPTKDIENIGVGVNDKTDVFKLPTLPPDRTNIANGSDSVPKPVSGGSESNSDPVRDSVPVTLQVPSSSGPIADRERGSTSNNGIFDVSGDNSVPTSGQLLESSESVETPHVFISTHMLSLLDFIKYPQCVNSLVSKAYRYVS